MNILFRRIQRVVKTERIARFITGKHPFNTVFSFNWIYVRNIIMWFKQHKNLFSDAVVCDYGAGNAPYLSLFEQHIKHCFLLDFYLSPVKTQKISQINLNMDGSIPVDFPSKADVIISTQVVMEVDDLTFYFDQINKLSHYKTKLFLTTPFIQTLGYNDKIRISPFFLKQHLDRIGYEIIEYKTAGYLFSGMSLCFNMALVLKNEYDPLTSNAKISINKTIVFAPIIFLTNVMGVFLDKIVPLYRVPSNFLVIAEKIR